MPLRLNLEKLKGAINVEEVKKSSPAYNLLPKEIEKLLPPLYASEDKKKDEILVPLKIFDCGSHWTWYIYEYDPKDKLFYAWVHGDFDEFGYVSLVELEGITNNFGLPLERDLYWKTDTTLQQVIYRGKR